VTKIANNTATSCGKFLYYAYTADNNNNTIFDTLFSHSDQIVEKLSSTEEDIASGLPIGTDSKTTAAAGQQQCECWTSWRT